MAGLTGNGSFGQRRTVAARAKGGLLVLGAFVVLLFVIELFNMVMLRSLNATGRVFLTHTRLDDRYVIRASIGAQATTSDHVDALWALIEEHA